MHVSRSQWLGLGAALTAIGCSSHGPASTCGSTNCDKATQVCLSVTYDPVSGGGPTTADQCVSAAASRCDAGTYGNTCDCLATQIVAASQGAVSATDMFNTGCAGGGYEARYCDVDWDAGVVQSSCFPHVCYGSPPLRRRARVS